MQTRPNLFKSGLHWEPKFTTKTFFACDFLCAVSLNPSVPDHFGLTAIKRSTCHLLISYLPGHHPIFGTTCGKDYILPCSLLMASQGCVRLGAYRLAFNAGEKNPDFYSPSVLKSDKVHLFGYRTWTAHLRRCCFAFPKVRH